MSGVGVPPPEFSRPEQQQSCVRAMSQNFTFIAPI